MAKLKACFEELGFDEVSTYINSGNVFFTSPAQEEQKLVEKIENGIAKTFGFPVRVVVRDEKNIQEVVDAIPEDWKNGDGQKSDVLFLWDEYRSPKSLELLKKVDGVDTLIYVDGAILWNIEFKNYSKSGMRVFMGTELYKNMTARNVNTIRKLAALLRTE